MKAISRRPVCCVNFFTVLLPSIFPLNNNQNEPLDLFGTDLFVTEQKGPDQRASQIAGIMGALQIAPLFDQSFDVNGPSANIMDSLATSESEAQTLPFLNLLTGSKNHNGNESNAVNEEGPSNQVSSQTGQDLGPENSG